MAFNFAVGIAVLPVLLFLFLLPVALLVALQVWLCKKSLKLGLILPGLSLALSLVLVFSMSMFALVTDSVVSGGYNEIMVNESDEIMVNESGGPIIHVEPEVQQKAEVPVRTLIAIGVLFLVANVPTVVFGGVWLHYKGRRDTLEDLKRMRIEDLG